MIGTVAILSIAAALSGCSDSSHAENHATDLPHIPAFIPESHRADNPNNSFQDCQHLVPGEIFQAKYNEMRNGINFNVYMETCERPMFRMGLEVYLLSGHSAKGSSTRLFWTRDNKFVLKIQDDSSFASREMFWREHAAMHQARHTGVISVIQPEANLNLLSVECRSRSFVMNRVMGKDLFNYMWLSSAQILDLGKAALMALEKFHDTGVIHGDIHPGNIMVSSVTDFTKSITLIDFGRSMSYMDPVLRTHRPQSELRPFNPLSGLNWDLLSINELEGKSVSRADDVFRLAETLIFLCMRTLKIYPRTTPIQVAHMKRMRTFDHSMVPKRIQHLYYHAIDLDFTERPNYRFLN